MTEPTFDNFLFFDLQESALTPGKPFPGFAVGSFVDMMGREVEFGKDAINEFLDNTLKAIKDAITKKMPGLPIDARQHDKGDAAGWITGAELGEVKDSNGNTVPVIKVLAEWTTLGVQLIKDRIQTNFSPTVDLRNKVIKGGSLTNWPASVDENGTPLFEAVELAQGVNCLKAIEAETSQEMGGDAPNSEETVTMAEQVIEKPEAGKEGQAITVDLSAVRESLRAELREEIRNEVIGELAPEGKANPEEAMSRLRETLNLEAFANVADLGQARDAMLGQMKQALEAEYNRMQSQAGKMLAEMMGQIKRDQHVAELAQRWTGGTEEKPYGLPVGREEIETFLLNLSDKQRAAAESIFGRIWADGLTEFSEVGHGKKVQGTRLLEPEIAAQLQAHVGRGGKVADFFDAAGPLLGDMAQYDLSAFEKGDK